MPGGKVTHVHVVRSAALEAVVALGLAPAEHVQPVIGLLWRLHAMLTGLGKAGR